MKIAMGAVKAIALVWYSTIVAHQNLRLGGAQLLTPQNGVFSLLAFGLLAVWGPVMEALFRTTKESMDEEGKISRERLREHLHDQDCADISDVQEQIPSVYQDLQDYAKNHRLKKTGDPGFDTTVLPVLDPQILRDVENASEQQHDVLWMPNSDLELFGTQYIAGWFSNPDVGDIKKRRSAVRRKRKVARKLKTCLYIRAWIRSVVPPESLRVELDEDGEMFIDKATNCLVDNKLREFFKLHCFNLQSIAEYQDLAKVIVFYTNEELGMARLLEPRLGKPLPR